jgi:opacity protein-like surface antigen
MNKTTLRIISGLLISAAAPTLSHAADLAPAGYDWTGFYLGVSAGVAGAGSDASVNYSSGALNGGAGWTSNGMYASGDALDHHYESTRGLLYGADEDGGHVSSSQMFTGTWYELGEGTSYYLQKELANYDVQETGALARNGGSLLFSPTSAWADSLSQDALNGLGSARLGYNLQYGAFVFGIEADGSLMTNLTSASVDIDEEATFSGIASDGFNNDLDELGLCYDDNSGPDEDDFEVAGEVYELTSCNSNGGYRSNYSQSGGFEYDSSVDGLFTARARMGFAVGRAMFFGSGGLAGGMVSMSTSAHVDETVNASWDASRGYEGYNTDTFDDNNGGSVENESVDSEVSIDEQAIGQHNEVYGSEWGGSMSETAWGWTAGGGMSFAITDNAIWTTEAYYYDLGEHSLRVTDARYGASYEVSQRFDGYMARTGIEWKF